jgi:dolichol kinase
MKNWKTSLTGVLTAAVALVAFYGYIPQEAGALIVALGVAIFSLLVKDNDVTGI